MIESGVERAKVPSQLQAQKERKFAEARSGKSERRPPRDSLKTRWPKFCAVIHSVLGVERAKVPGGAVFRSRKSGTYKVPGAERAKAGKGGECEKRKNPRWRRARKSTGRRESESSDT